jgi:hypothetical protein
MYLPVLAGYWVLTQLSTWLLITFLDDPIIIQVGYQPLHTDSKIKTTEKNDFLFFKNLLLLYNCQLLIGYLIIYLTANFLYWYW